jgi:hypothetical protein
MPVFPIVSTPCTPKRLESAGNQTESSHEGTSNGKETIPGFDRSICCLILVAKRVLERMILDLRAFLLIEKVHIAIPGD